MQRACDSDSLLLTDCIVNVHARVGAQGYSVASLAADPITAAVTFVLICACTLILNVYAFQDTVTSQSFDC